VAFLVWPTILIFKTLVDDINIVQLITFKCLGGILEGNFELSKDERLFYLRILGSSLWKTDLREEQPEEEREVSEWTGVPWDRDLIQAFLRSVRRLLRDILKAFSFEEFLCHLKIGMPDPAQTGIILGMSYPITEMISSNFPEGDVKVVVEPVWGRTKLDVSARGELSFRLVSLIIPLIRFFLNSSVRKFMKAVRKKK
jgi:hypothetical protein